MIELKKLKKDVCQIQEYLQKYGGSVCDLSVGVKYMWRDEFEIEYAIIENTLIMKEDSKEYKDTFYYPLGENIDGALTKIEEYCREKNIELKYCCVDTGTTKILAERYDKIEIRYDRDWSDYIYDAEKFKTYSGKKYSGQRNHVNKFKRLYPNYIYRIIEKTDLARIKRFLDEYNSKHEHNFKHEESIEHEEKSTPENKGWTEKLEQDKVLDLMQNMFELNQVGGLIEIEGKVVAISIGERINDTLIIHAEKALKEYEGIYPLMAQEFAKCFAKDVKYINREEDCGDKGLRTSKLQYNPIEIKEKNIVKVQTLFDKIKSPIFIKTQRLEIADISERDKESYQKLYINENINKWWGYDYKADLGDKQATADYFYNFAKELKEKKEEYSLLVKKDKIVIGEIVLYNFDYFGGVEIGYRFFSEQQGKGYATESVGAVVDFVMTQLKAKKIMSKCYKENVNSEKLIKKLGFEKIRENSTHYFFEKT